MTNMTNYDVFDEIFEAVMDELGLSGWWELFDSDEFDEVERRIAERFSVAEVTEVESFVEWYNIMAEEL